MASPSTTIAAQTSNEEPVGSSPHIQYGRHCTDGEQELQPLCTSCNKIPLQADRISELESNMTTWTLGAWIFVRQRNCPFCQLVKFVFMQHPSQPEEFELVEVIWQWQNYSSVPGFMVLSPWNEGNLICFMEGSGEPFCRMRSTYEKFIDLDIPKQWLLTCEREHGNRCFALASEEGKILTPNGHPLTLRLIDVRAMSIVEAPDSCRYLALSYVWGDAEDGRLLLNQSNVRSLMAIGSLQSARASIPRTILDAMELVQIIGERYLWVDSLCLVQDDPDELQQYIGMMDLIYEMAIVTIVCGSGNDAHDGLRGVYPTPRETINVVKEVTPGVKLAVAIVSYEPSLSRSHYGSRAWTMQEQLCSSRLFVFINGEVYFRCRSGVYYEGTTLPGHPFYNCRANTLSSTEVFRRDVPAASGLIHLLEPFSQRRLTYESDVLRAVGGMFRRWTEVHGVHFVEGLPIGAGILLSDSLLFTNSQLFSQGIRRSDLPSYSWAGWRLAAEWHCPPYGGSLFSTWIVWYCKSPEGNFRTFDESGKLEPSAYPDFKPSNSHQELLRWPVASSKPIPRINPPYTLLYFWTVCVNFKLVEVEPYNSVYSSSTKLAHMLLGVDGDLCGEVFLDNTDILMQKTIELALLSEYKYVHNRRCYCTMLLKWDGGIAERRGMALIPKERLADTLPPGPMWKQIILG